MSLPRWEVRHPTLQHYRIISGPHGRAHTCGCWGGWLLRDIAAPESPLGLFGFSDSLGSSSCSPKLSHLKSWEPQCSEVWAAEPRK